MSDFKIRHKLNSKNSIQSAEARLEKWGEAFLLIEKPFNLSVEDEPLPDLFVAKLITQITPDADKQIEKHPD